MLYVLWEDCDDFDPHNLAFFSFLRLPSISIHLIVSLFILMPIILSGYYYMNSQFLFEVVQ
jgi:hypothetical protein